MASREIGTLDRSSLERFQTELIEAGFEPEDDERRSWVGPIADSLRDLTAAETMRIRFVDGWPFQHPRLHADGLDWRHVSANGEVCLWQSGAPSGQWLTWAGYIDRIDEWVEQAKAGFRPEDFALDAHLSFGEVRPGIATLELDALELGKAGALGELSGTWKQRAEVLEVAPGLRGEVGGRWYQVGDLNVPPRDLEGVRSLLSKGQLNNFNRRFQNVSKDGKARLFLIAWDRDLGRDVLVILAELVDGEVVAKAIEVAPTDAAILKLRAGPDVDALKTKTAVVFGVGAVGSHVSLLLARCGLGAVIAIDAQTLRPGDVVRHAADSFLIGYKKATAVRLTAGLVAPWTKVVPLEGATWDPEQIRAALDGVDLVIETTGMTSFCTMLSLICEQERVPLLSAALYRAGAIARVRRQATPGDTPILARSDDRSYLAIPPENEEDPVFEPGCSAPVNNASPIAVSSVAALTADVAVDFLSGRNAYPDEVIDVYRPLDDAPFDKLGRIHS